METYWEAERKYAEHRADMIREEIIQHQNEIKELRKLARENRKRIAECDDMIAYNQERATR